jgi:hypothetical protein
MSAIDFAQLQVGSRLCRGRADVREIAGNQVIWNVLFQLAYLNSFSLGVHHKLQQVGSKQAIGAICTITIHDASILICMRFAVGTKGVTEAISQLP